MAETKRQRYEIVRATLEQERASFLPTWRQLGEYILPRSPRFLVTDVNKGDRRSSKIIDCTATLAAGTLQMGMMAGLSSPARPWFRLTTPDEGLADYGPVKDWLYQTTSVMQTSFARGNLYNCLPKVYGHEGVFGTAAMVVEEDFQEVSRFTSLPVGSYMLGTDERGTVCILFREMTMTVRQIVRKFGVMGANGQPDWSNFSRAIKEAWEKGRHEDRFQVCHIVQPNEDHDPEKLHAKFKRFSSTYYEKGYANDPKLNYLKGADGEKMLRESGFDRFPVLAPRWEATGEDTYASSCPGLIALGDVKQLQLGERRMMQAIEKMVNPPMVGDPKLKSMRHSILPGEVTYLAEVDGKPAFRPLYQVDPRVKELWEKQLQVKDRIEKAFFVNMFLMMAESDRREMTAAEVAERHEEKLFALGPMLEQQNQDLFNPLIDMQFDLLLKQGQIPPPPPELEGVELKVDFVSIMAQAQKLVGVSNIERFTNYVGSIAAQTKDPTVLDKVNIDALVDAYGDATSVPPGVIRTDEEVEKIKQDRAAAVAQEQQMQRLALAARGARDLAGANMGEDNALTRVVGAAAA